jgi:fatty acid desaturase
MEWLLTPLLTYQNYHLVHHLYPTVPFYRYRRLWESRADWHNAQQPSTVAPFRLTPDRLRENDGASDEAPAG